MPACDEKSITVFPGRDLILGEAFIYPNNPLMSCFSLFFKKKEVSRATHTIDVEDEVSSVQNASSYTYRELQRATDNFKPANKVGEGGFGSVYKGMLRDGTMAAVKVLSAESRQEGNHRILVYGYLENNSLAQTLLDKMDGLNNVILLHLLSYISHAMRGYLAPEYAIRGQLTRKADIYSFGVLLLEIVSGRSNTNRRLPPEEQYLVERAAFALATLGFFSLLGSCKWTKSSFSNDHFRLKHHPSKPSRIIAHFFLLNGAVWEFYQKQELVNLVDTSLGGNYDVEEACNYLKIGLLCTQDVPKQRPSMSTVVLMLMGEIEVSDKISRPGMLSEFMSFKGDNMRKHRDEKDQNNKWEMKDSGKGESSSSSLGLAETSNATMTFSSIYDRDN
ncbi:hypothetical protein DKX38_017661 [Salix brachista]|uniref:Protein kinase domain-containing protein n=1 Tax=Salix brachista TaxID=2182728 RepID=A0A5N5KVU6_9ROSI|nr:hypothetical protein DKX38_017661 [Salix brachista]